MNTTDQNEQIQASFGQWLKEKRIAQKISLEEVSTKTSIRPSILEAIEAEDHEKLPAKVYAVGFIRAYAREVGLDPDEAVHRYHLHQDSEADEKMRLGWDRTDEIYTKPNRHFRWLFYLLAGLVLVLVAWWSYFWLWPKIAERLPSQSSIGTVQPEAEKTDPATASVPTDNAVSELAKEMAVVGPTVEPAGENAAIKADSNPTPRALTLSEEETPDAADDNTLESETAPIAETVEAKTPMPAETATVDDNAAASETPAQQTPETKTMDLSSGFELTIDALATTWLRVTPDDDPPIEYTLHQGDQKEFQVSSQVQLSIGNAGGVELTVNGQPYPIAGESGEVVRITIP